MLGTWRVDSELALPGWSVAGSDRIVDSQGRVRWLLAPPARREWSPTGALLASEPRAAALRETPGGATVSVSGPSEVDFLELDRAAADAARCDRSGEMTVIGSYATLGPPPDLARFLVGGQVLDTNDFGGRRCPSEQTALSIFRIARWRGGPFWAAVAAAVADVAERRFREAPGGVPVHDLDGHGEAHTRFLADGLLLLLAAGRPQGAARAAAAVESFGAPWGGGTWYLHDSREKAEDENNLVLNTHVHAMIALRAAGRTTAGAGTALNSALRLHGEGWRAWVLAGLLAASDAAGALGRGGALAHRAQAMASRSRRRRPHLRLPGGWLARDAGLGPAPSYLVVNLSDLAVLERNSPTRESSKALRAGLRYARASGHLRARRRARDPLVVLVPAMLRNAGLPGLAGRAAATLRADGWAPAIGWPGYEDHLWPALARGTP